jgi:hypothetical protein
LFIIFNLFIIFLFPQILEYAVGGPYFVEVEVVC